MNTTSRTVTGILAVALGALLIYIAIRHDRWLIIHGSIIFGLGVYIFFNKKEDDIEQIKK